MRILLLGPLPPPLGGMAAHVGLLRKALLSRGVLVEVLEVPPRGSRIAKSAWVAFRELVRRRTDLAHLHLAGGRKAYRVAKGLQRYFHALGVPFVVTLHGGGFVSFVESNSEAKAGLRELLSSAAAVVAVNGSIASYVVSSFGLHSSSVHVVSPYLSEREAVPRAGTEKVLRSLVACGSGTSVYGLLDLVQAVRTTGSVRAVDICLYGTHDPSYLNKLLDLCRRDERIQVFWNMQPKEFSERLMRAELFVRPTYADGDSLALREAIDLGCQVIASDAAIRPPGCGIYQCGKNDELAELIDDTLAGRAVLSAPDFEGLGEPADVAAMLAIYQLSIGTKQCLP